ncbi:CAMK family protein kinase [Tritrichomonas foetus]|uniref:CAMK family protein kinase n=1 Tax=Tritrichomonas foetus TaxID=1144522 RepID=A0A1J4JQ44_9EUKA|nr:CAMK family protein kinase [Tritrichomonas foetus]|eukprot:OHT01171.1 CAMK family protein kinase [Tritrichomonas foetus]
MQEIGDYCITSKIGNGGYSTVFLGYHKCMESCQYPVAIKLIEVNNSNSTSHCNEGAIQETKFIGNKIDSQFISNHISQLGKDRKHKEEQCNYSNLNVENELNILQNLSHSNIASLFDYVKKENCWAFVLEYAANGSIGAIAPLGNEIRVYKYFMQIVDAIYYLHIVKHIVHRDIKIENILLDEFFNIKLCDFGFAQVCDTFLDSNCINARCGSPAFTSPEIILGQKYNQKTDIWSLGIVLYFLVTGTVPFEADNVQKLFYMITNNDVVFPDDCHISNELKDLITIMLDKNQFTRIDIIEVKNHPWFVLMDSQVISRRLSHNVNMISITEKEFKDHGLDYYQIKTDNPKMCETLTKLIKCKIGRDRYFSKLKNVAHMKKTQYSRSRRISQPSNSKVPSCMSFSIMKHHTRSGFVNVNTLVRPKIPRKSVDIYL